MRVLRLILIVFITLIPLRIGCATLPPGPTVLKEIVVTPEDYSQVILNVLCNAGVSDDLAFTILAQGKHESGNFKSKIFEEGWNVFGMKCPRKRPTTCTGTNRGHATYNSVEEATLDYVLWMEHFNIPKDCSTKKYIFLLKKKHYFEDNVNKYYKSILKHKKL